MIKRVGAGLVSAGLMWLITTAPVSGQKTSNPGVSVTFNERVGDAIVSDGHGPYVNGIGGVVGQIYVSASGDMTLNLNRTRPNRVFNGVYTPAGDVMQPAPSPPSGAFSDGFFINVARVWQIPVDPTLSTSTFAAFDAGVGSFRLCGSSVTACGGVVTERVTVTRTATDTWVVSAETASAAVIGSDLAVLVNIKGQQPRGYYHMPFHLTIRCTNALCR